MNFHENLIAEMRKRPMLWNRYHDYYNNRPVTDREWDNISKTFKKSKEFVKQKWRTLRDQFLRELKKVKIPQGVVPDKPLIHYYRGQWHYFEQLLFLRNAVTTRKTRSPSPDDIEQILLESAKESELKEDELKDGEMKECEVKIEAEEWESGSESLHFTDFTETNGNDTIVDKGVPEVEMRETEHSNAMSAPVIVNAPLTVIADRKRKLSDFECLQTKQPKLTAETVIDDDLHFAKSLVPYFRKLSSVRKLLVRNEIQNILIRETLCNDCKCTADAPPKCD